MQHNGKILIDKPKGWTSFDIVAKIRSLIRKQTGIKRPKVGHAGTLDPLATGLLIVLVGDYCKRANEFLKLDKTYEVNMKLGANSSTDDAEGIFTEISDNRPTKISVNKVLNSFVGTIQQVPPIFSAIKISGKRAYTLARAGEQPEMQPRSVTIYSITNIKYDYPMISFTTKVSSGTYIRSLVRDIGNKLGTGAYMTNLRRTRIDSFLIENAHQIDAINDESLDHIIQ